MAKKKSSQTGVASVLDFSPDNFGPDLQKLLQNLHPFTCTTKAAIISGADCKPAPAVWFFVHDEFLRDSRPVLIPARLLGLDPEEGWILGFVTTDKTERLLLVRPPEMTGPNPSPFFHLDSVDTPTSTKKTAARKKAAAKKKR